MAGRHTGNPGVGVNHAGIMRFALINPPWTFDGSIYFGCREPHLPLEYGYARALLRRAGHDAEIFDGQLGGLSRADLRSAVAAYSPHVAVVTTAPSYLFWRCAPPELRIPQEIVREVRAAAETVGVVGPHASTTPAATLNKVGADAVVVGECEDILPKLAAPKDRWGDIDALCVWVDGAPRVRGSTHTTNLAELPSLHWPDDIIARHRHHHHRFE